jgi:hypothetical protein
MSSEITWYLHKDGTNYGPYTWEELCRHSIEPSDLVWNNTMTNWIRADQVPGLPLRSAMPGFPPRQDARQIPNYLVWSILVTILCCWPLGIPAIVYAAQVNGKINQGDYDGALRASNNAKTFCWISFALGLVGNIVVLIGIFSGLYEL